MTEENLVLYKRVDNVAVITLNRPEKRNALSHAALLQLDAAFEKANSDDEVRAIVLEGEGKSFCAGADLSGDGERMKGVKMLENFENHHARYFRFWDSRKVTVCAVQGHALGRGLEIALCADIIIAEEDAKIGQPEVREGFVIWSVVPWLVNPQKAKLFMISGDMVDGHEAEKMGLVGKVVPSGTAREAALKTAKRLSHIPALASASIKKMINGTYESMGFRAQQEAGTHVTALISSFTPEEKGIAELVRIRQEQGLKASLRYRDAPFEE